MEACFTHSFHCPGECCAPFNSLRPRPNRRHFADDIFKWIFINQNIWILIKISLKFVPKGPINNIPALVQIMAWRRPGDKPLSEPMMLSSLTHICVTRPQWVKTQKQSGLKPTISFFCTISMVTSDRKCKYTFLFPKIQHIDGKPWCWNNIQGKLSQYYGCWCPRPLHHQNISHHNIGCVR